jgi:hypothetical protein
MKPWRKLDNSITSNIFFLRYWVCSARAGIRPPTNLIWVNAEGGFACQQVGADLDRGAQRERDEIDGGCEKFDISTELARVVAFLTWIVFSNIDFV